MANKWRLHLSKILLSSELVICFFLNVSPIWLLPEKTTRKDRTVNDGEKRLQFSLQLCPRYDFGGSGVQKATKVFDFAFVKLLNSATSNGQTRIETVVAGNTRASN